MKNTIQSPLIYEFNLFINASKNKKRIQAGGKPISKATIRNYLNTRRLLVNFSVTTQFNLLLYKLNPNSNREFITQKKYWKNFHKNFSDFLFDELGNFDNYVGAQFKIIRTFMKWLSIEKGYNLNPFIALLPVYKEDPPIVVLTPPQLSRLIHFNTTADSLPLRLDRIKDLFVFGCTVALRISDLYRLKRDNVTIENGNSYLSIISKKTTTSTKILLPDYALAIIRRNKSSSVYLFPKMSITNLNKYIKELIEVIGWNDVIPKHRYRRGVPIVVFKDPLKKVHFKFYDHISSHTMRKTAISTMLRFGMDELNVRKISGHSPSSKEFFRYVKLNQDLIDEQCIIVHENLQNIA